MFLIKTCGYAQVFIKNILALECCSVKDKISVRATGKRGVKTFSKIRKSANAVRLAHEQMISTQITIFDKICITGETNLNREIENTKKVYNCSQIASPIGVIPWASDRIYP